MRTRLPFILLLCLSAEQPRAEDCPWKLVELGPRLEESGVRIASAWQIAAEKDEEIARLRHAAVLGCKSAVEANIKSFDSSIRGLDIRAELDQGETMALCIRAKRAQVNAKTIEARKTSNRMLEQRLLRISAEIERLAPMVLDQNVRIHQLASKLERLAEERKRLLASCDMEDF